ncbi:hypothetical protein L873DRAFT_1795552 [Choiromyces venosus 120613-1]|uniref:Uncharacterized protein n=1 Tax=Choiromyces venosus 120613-1 TaxID=1336337 RepID=A0A3N4IWG5_9PEZI|nr:hypothetical protein L873DRAFT_1795552 [Choiromyces venosus 120613-1]
MVPRAKESLINYKIESCYGGGNPEKYAEGSKESNALQDLSQKDEEHWQRTFPEIASELGIPAACSTLEQIFHSQHNIFQRKTAHKPSLLQDQIEAQLAFAYMAIHIAINIIIFTNEMWVEFNKPHCQWNVSQYRGINANENTLHNKDNEKQPICVMFWGAIVNGVKGPYHIWELETAEGKENYQQIVSKENQMYYEQQEFNHQQAQLPGTWQHGAFTIFNNNIKKLNIEEGRGGYYKHKWRCPEQIF